jgi:hypothetical protein
MNSAAYQLSSRFEGEWKDEYTTYYARKYVRMLSAPEIHDAIALATGKPGKFPTGQESVGMVMQMSEPKKAGAEVQSFMKVFGQSNRDDMPKKVPPSALQAMLLMQSKVVTDRIDLAPLLATSASDSELIEQLFLRSIARRPTPQESAVAFKAMATNRQKGAENLLWALINSPEFLFNY